MSNRNPPILLVGDEPSRLNTDPNVAFMGSKSEPMLRYWVEILTGTNPLFIKILNSHTEELLKEVIKRWSMNYSIVALGNKASSRLTKYKVDHFKMPHPSPRNRQLNDKIFVENKLRECLNYIREHNNVHDLRGMGKTKNDL